ncbi:hypothetical protein NDU88_003895 [Pleurodeles waltl]|uniref:Uncharacterized protein n=1 Tax=Pleurodeles waltl TaxID=8319 RepID=A0AAV7QD59_PLEWA|nr:hypothetical protein NDU88_003895 [Pleurodeles waltl]
MAPLQSMEPRAETKLCRKVQNFKPRLTLKRRAGRTWGKALTSEGGRKEARVSCREVPRTSPRSGFVPTDAGGHCVAAVVDINPVLSDMRGHALEGNQVFR